MIETADTPRWRKMLVQLQALGYGRQVEFYYDMLPFDPSPFEHFHATIMAGGRMLQHGEEITKNHGLGSG
jgi:hypothetical protein